MVSFETSFVCSFKLIFCGLGSSSKSWKVPKLLQKLGLQIGIRFRDPFWPCARIFEIYLFI